MSRYSDLIISQGATNYWQLEETTTPYIDVIGGVDLGYSTGASDTLAVVENGVDFNASGFARTSAIDGTIVFNNTQGFSYSFMAYLRNYDSNRGFLSKRNATSINRSFAAFVFNSTAGTGLCFDIGNNQVRWSTGHYPPLNEWVHIAFTYDPSTLTSRAYVNGALIASVTYVTQTPQSTQGTANFMIGAMQSGTGGTASNFLNGGMDEVAFFTNKTLSAAEIRAQYDTAFPIMRVKNTNGEWHDADRRVL